ncbi:MAG: UDP-N-acetylmuramoylalanine--D-glutamate ligase [Saprospiraceae bacterium]|jgi:UDP-N-acetylmuramoylalanine--D-glutamate ligase
MKVVILGAGESGVGAALLAKQLKYEVFVSDRGSIKEKYKQELIENNIPFEENKHSEKKIFEASEIIKSPGIPDKVDLIHRLKDAGIPVISEIEFAGKHTNATIVAITGSNGKTTTTNLTYHLLQSAGLDAALGGNVGYSFARLLTEELHQYYVLELSSFQLDGIKAFRPDISMLLNISPDHLDRYEYKMENYVASKFRVMMNQRAEDHFIFNAKDENILSFLKNEKLKVNLIEVDDVKTTNEKLIVNQFDFDLSQTSLKGRHNLFNATCAIKAAILLGVEKKAIQLGLNSFVNAPHRLESVCTTNNVEYINDSKATNVDAVYFALDAMTKPIVWIVGGTDKGNDYGPILDLVESKVKAIVCLGLDNTKILEVFTPIVKNIEETKSANEAVAIASTYAESGDVVLLSPACASFDLFKNYEDRGDQFKSAVLGLKIKD